MARDRDPEHIARTYRARLQGPIRFGDPEAIATLKQWRQELEKAEEAEIETGEERPFVVTYSVTKDRTIWAHSLAEAEEMAETDLAYEGDVEILDVEPE